MHSEEVIIIENEIEAFNHIIEVETFLDSLNEPGLKIIDFRKLEDYKKGHIPNAIRIWRSDIEDDNYPYGGMMADKKSIEKLFSRLGINDGDTLVVYDDRGGCDAARLWWVLQNYDYPHVEILNGGLHAWVAAGGAFSMDEHVMKPTEFKLPEASGMRFLVHHEELHKMVSAGKAPVLIDARTANEFSGKRQKKGSKKGGRIPTSKLVDWSRTIDYHGTHKFKPVAELEKIYGDLAKSKDKPIIVYCHTGVRSAHTTFVLTQLLGYTNVRNYDGSWSEWSHFEHLPFEKDSITVILE